MKVFTAEFNCCFECPAFSLEKGNPWTHECYVTGEPRFLGDENTPFDYKNKIPEWCSLPDAKNDTE